MRHLFTIILFFLAAATQAQTNDYAISVDKSTTITHAERRLNSICLQTEAGLQTIDCNQGNDRLLYQDCLSKGFSVKAGETVTPTFQWTGVWMSGYVYVDYDNDGAFSFEIQSDGLPSANSDLKAYSYYEGKNSVGASVANGDVINPPSFTIPATLANGVYRMRYKVDWNSLDPAGSQEWGNDILTNGGAIADTRMIIHGEEVTFRAGVEGVDADIVSATLPYGKAYTLNLAEFKAKAGDGMILKTILVRHGFNLTGPQYVHGTPQYVTDNISSLMAEGETLEIPASMMDGDVEVSFQYVVDQSISSSDMPAVDTNIEGLSFTSLVVTGSKKRTYTPAENNLAWQNFSDGLPVPVQEGGVFTVSTNATLKGADLSQSKAHLLVDLNQNGKFAYGLEESESSDAFQLPEDLTPGRYNALLYYPEEKIFVSFPILVHSATVHLTIESQNARVKGKYVYGASGERSTSTGVPAEVAAYKTITLVAMPIVDGYKSDGGEVTITTADGQKSSYEFSVSATGTITIPADSVYGDIRLKVDYFPTSSVDMYMVFSDEFNDKTLSTKKWTTSTRYGAAWNRFISSDKRVAYTQDGNLVCRCIANPGDTSDTAEMLSGAKETRGKFGFNHGYVEARIFTHPHTGNFPAFWLMPVDQSDGWPTCGEIDIWETIDNQDVAYHTVHSHWTYDLKNGGNGGNEACVQNGEWHTYGLKKDADRLTWYVDGNQVFTYAKSTDESQLSQGQWPYDKAFYLILNQSVGNGSWAKSPDMSYTYETLFDWVRVYQTEEEAAADKNKIDGISEVLMDDCEADDFYSTSSKISKSASFDLQGRRISNPSKGQLFIKGGQLRIAK